MALDDLTAALSKDGRLPGIEVEVFPLDRSGRLNGGKPYSLKSFTSYTFSSNILIPVDTCGFAFRPNPPTRADRSTYFDRIVREGDTIQLTMNGRQGRRGLSTGYVDAIDTETDTDLGVTLRIGGRDLMGFLEDNDAVNPDASIIWTNVANINNVVPKLLAQTRIKGFETRNIDNNVKSLFATNPGESKLAALQRFLDPINAIAWMDGGGKLICGKPSFDGDSQGTLGVLAFQNRSNVLNFRARRASGQIPNAVLSIWTGLENVQNAVSKRLLKQNPAEGPNRLYQAKHYVYRTIVTSAPDANDTKTGLTEVQRIISQGANYLDALAAREIARENINELIVTCTVPGHLNAQGDPFMPDQCYQIVHDADGIDEKMYLFGCDYVLSEDSGQVTHLSFCKLNTIVAGGPLPTAENASITRTA